MAAASTNVSKRHRELSANSPLPKTPRLSDYGNTPKLLQLLDQRFAKQSDDIAAKILQSEQHILSTLDGRITDLQRDLGAITQRVERLELIASDVVALKADVASLKAQLAKQDNIAVACDMRLHGVPVNSDENLLEIFNTLCKTLNIEPPVCKTITRLKNNNNAQNKSSFIDAPIIIKLTTPQDKNFMMRTIAEFRNTTKDLLRLHHLGFQSAVPIYINECLSKENHTILKKAITYKKHKQVHAAFTRRGLVYVRRSHNDVPVCINSHRMLEQLICAEGRVVQNSGRDSEFFRSHDDNC